MIDHTCSQPFEPCAACSDETQRNLHGQVLDFHLAFGIPISTSPCVPERDRVTLRLRLIAEEFCELLEACDAPNFALTEAEHWIAQTIAGCGTRKDVDLVKAVDALADLDYVVEGTRIEFGVDGKPIANAVHRSNMAKVGGGIRGDGKILKPDGWTAPDIRGLLVAQGWVP